MTTHPKIIIATPDRYLLFTSMGLGVVICQGKSLGPSIHSFEHAVCVIFSFLINFFLKELIILESRNS